MGLFDEELGITQQSNSQVQQGGLFDEELGLTKNKPNPTEQVINPGIKNTDGNGYAVAPTVTDVPAEPVYPQNNSISGNVTLWDNSRRFNDKFAGQNRWSRLSAYNQEMADKGKNKGLGFRLGQVGNALLDVPKLIPHAQRDFTEDLSGLGDFASMVGKGVFNGVKGGWNAIVHPKRTISKINKAIGDLNNKANNINEIDLIAQMNPLTKAINLPNDFANSLNSIRRSELGSGFQEFIKDQYGQNNRDMVYIGKDGKPVINVDASGILQAAYAHPFNTALDLSSFGLANSGIKYLSKLGKANKVKALNKAKNVVVGAVDKATSANPNLADKVTKAADAIGVDASKLNENTAKMSEFNKLVEEGKAPKYSETQEKAIEHSKLANEEQSTKLIDELTHGVEENKNVKEPSSLEELSQSKFNKSVDDLTPEEWNKLYEEQSKNNKVKSETSQEPLSHVEQKIDNEVPKEVETPQNEHANDVKNNSNTNETQKLEKTQEEINRQSNLNWGRTLEKNQRKRVVTDEAGNIIYEYKDGRKFPKRELDPYTNDDTARLLRGGFNGYAKNPQKFYDKMIKKIEQCTADEPQVRQKMINQLNEAADRFENTKMAEGKKINRYMDEGGQALNDSNISSKGNLINSINRLIATVNKKKVSELVNTNPVFEHLKEHLAGFENYNIIIDNTLGSKGEHVKGTVRINLNAIGDNEELFANVVAHEFQHAKQTKYYNELIGKSNLTDIEKNFIDMYEDCRKANNELKSATTGNENFLKQVYENLNNIDDIGKQTEYLKTLTNDEWDIYYNHYKAKRHYLRTPLEREARDVGKQLSEEYSRANRRITKGNSNAGKTMERRWDDGLHKSSVWNDIWSRKQQKRGVNSDSFANYDNGVPEQPKSVADSKPVEHKTVTKNDLKDVDFGDTYNSNTARKYVANTSKDTENTLIELGLLDREQAANRLKQQSSKTGEDKAYFKGKRNVKDGIDIDKDYNLSAKTKEGLFGKKSKDGINEIGSAEDITREEINRNLHAHYTKNTTDYVAKNFALPIEDGKIKDGYIGVNRTLLNHMVHGRLSSEWYKTMAAGEDAIRKSFKNEGVAKTWIDIANKNSKNDFQIPKAVFDTLADGSAENAAVYWDRYARFDNPRGLAKGIGKFAGATTDALLNGFKRRVLASGSFVLNNRLGNQIMIYNTSKNPIEYLKSFYGASKLKDTDIPVELIQSNIAEAAKDALVRKTYTGYNAIDNAINLFNGQFIDTKSLKGMKKVAAQGANILIGVPNRAFNKISETVMKFNDKFERFERKQKFAQAMDKERAKLIKQTGQTLVKDSEVLKHINGNSEIAEAVIREVEDALGNYRSFNKFEKNIMKRIVPFYSWYRTITRHTFKLATTHPEKVARLRLELAAIGIDGKGDYSKKEYQRHSADLGIKDERSGNDLIINKEHGNPYNTFREDVGYNPYLTTAQEMIKGKKNFLDQEISNDRYIRKTKYVKGNKKTGYYDLRNNDWVRDNNGKIKFDEDTKFGALPTSTRLGYGLKTLAKNTVAPYLDNPLANAEQWYGAFDNKFTKDINKAEKGKFIPYDKSYDASLGGYNHGDRIGRKTKRYAANNLSVKNKMLNMLGLGIQNKGKLNKSERAEYKEKSKRIRNRMNNSK